MNLIAVEQAKGVLETMRAHPKKFNILSPVLGEILFEFNLSFSRIGTTPEEQKKLEQQCAIIKAKEYLALTETANPKWPWVAMFEVTLERHNLKPKDAGVSNRWLKRFKAWLIEEELLPLKIT